MKILFIPTGGTIDKDYPHTTKGWAFEFGEPAIRRLLEKLNPSFEYDIITPFQKDSLEIKEEDRMQLAELIEEQKASKIVITHGTDTILDTAAFLHQKIKDKLIILTGSMRPERFSNSDAPLNLGAAIGAANVLKEGVWVSMHGMVRPFDQMQRNSQTGQFF